MSTPVIARTEPLAIPTYGLGAPEKNPLFFEKRVYQGSNGKVYPLPFIDKVCQDDPPHPVDYRSVRLENEFVRLVILPEIGGRIFSGQDKANGDYDFFYRQDVIKPALVGLAGPWISGGVEFNWPQHHRPGTYMPADVHIEEEPDGVRTVWLSEHDPLNRLKGMHGIRLRPGSSLIELRGRLYNRTPATRTFLWWANVAARVHDNYQSFFPPDVHYVADHAVRSMSSFPVAENPYYGVDYAARPGANDLSWYRNIPVPTSYMICETNFGFFGGYDHDQGGGFVHVADRHISPGKKQWTWGNHAFGHAWDRELTDTGGPYVELMAGVYTDNQPDFSYLLPFETKTFSQFWWPYKGLGPVQQANRDLALRLVVGDDRTIKIGVAASRRFKDLRIVLSDSGRILLDRRIEVAPGHPWRDRTLRLAGESESSLELVVSGEPGAPAIRYRPVETGSAVRSRQLATEPPMPEEVDSADLLYLTGEHLEQYRHPTRRPEPYWLEALRRDPGDARSNTALGRLALDHGEFEKADAYLQAAVSRLTHRHPNPVTGEAHYYLGLARRFQSRLDEAYDLFSKATWNHEWRAAAHCELAALDLRRADAASGLGHAGLCLDSDRNCNRARLLRAICLRRLGRNGEARAVIDSLLADDPLDHWALAERSVLTTGTAALAPASRNDGQTALDVAFDYAEAGCHADAVAVLERHHVDDVHPVAVPNPLQRTAMTRYALAWLHQLAGDAGSARAELETARREPPDYGFPVRLHEMQALEWALAQPGADRNAAFALGNLYYDRRRHEDAIASWETARAADPGFATAHRNLGIAYWNVRSDGEAARTSYLEALRYDPDDARIVAEYDQLRARLGDDPAERLAFLEERRGLTLERDDAAVSLAALYNRTGDYDAALELLTGRTFHPWEGGEGKVLRQYTAARLGLGRAALDAGDAARALAHFEAATETPDSLGEKYHLLQAKADVTYWKGRALRALGRDEEAVAAFSAAAEEPGDFQQMAVVKYSELSYYKGRALAELGDAAAAADLFKTMREWARAEMEQPAKIDYFATSLPNLLVFEDDLDAVKREKMRLLVELAGEGLTAIR